MNQILEEQLSAALDGELPAAEVDLLLARIDRTPESRAKLARYAMIGEYLRSGTARPDSLDVAENVRSALIAESAPASRPRIAPTWLVAGAVAASTAIVAFLVTAPVQVPGNNEAQQVAAVAVASADEPVTGITPTANRRLNPAASARLTGYLVAHGEYAGELSRSSFDSRLVSARAERASWRRPQDADDAR